MKTKNKGMREMHFSIYEEKILNQLLTSSMKSKDKARLKYGFYLFLDSLKKGLLIYSFAIYLEIFMETFLMHISFLFVRQVSYGWHSSSKMGCILGSILCFTVVPYELNHAEMNKDIFFLMTVIFLTLLVYLGPVGTKVSKLSKKKIHILQKKLKWRIVLLAVLSVIIPITYYQYIITGVGIQLIMLFI
ncbi:accessory gene regulator B family protein, partial [Lysinibacillus sphaericus]